MKQAFKQFLCAVLVVVISLFFSTPLLADTSPFSVVQKHYTSVTDTVVSRTASVFSSVTDFFSNLFGHDDVAAVAVVQNPIIVEESTSINPAPVLTKYISAPSSSTVGTKTVVQTTSGISEAQLSTSLFLLENRLRSLIESQGSGYITVPPQIIPSTFTSIGTLTSGSINPGFGNIDIGSNALSAGNGIFSGNVLIGGDLTLSGNLIQPNGTPITSSQWGTSGSDIMYTIGNVGVGTTSPWKKLSVTGDISVTGAFFASNASAGTNGMILQTTGSGIQWVATSTLGFASATQIGSGIVGQIPYYASNNTNLTATSSLFLSTTGNIGIGTTLPQATLHVAGGTLPLKIERSGVDSLSFTNGSSIWNVTAAVHSLKLAAASGGANNILISNATSGDNGISFTAKNTEVLRIAGTGNVGIGTSSPSYKLDVVGNTRLTGGLSIVDSLGANLFQTAGTGFYVGRDPRSNGNEGLLVDNGQIIFRDSGNFNIAIRQNGYRTSFQKYDGALSGVEALELYVTNIKSPGNYQDIALGNGTVTIGGNYTSATPLVVNVKTGVNNSINVVNSVDGLVSYLDDIGGAYFSNNVGIGTNNPQAKLDVNGVANLAYPSDWGTVAGRAKISFGNENLYQFGVGYIAGLQNYVGLTSNNALYLMADNDSAIRGIAFLGADNTINFAQNAGTGNTYIKGMVGIGTTSPVFPLDVYSTVTSSQTYGFLNAGGTTGTATGANSYSIRAQGRVLASEFNAVSDARLKDVQFNVDSGLALSLITKLQPVSFTWKSQPNGRPIIGFLAQDVEAIIPNAVSKLATENFGDQRELDYNQVLTMTVGAVKELNTNIEYLKSAFASTTINEFFKTTIVQEIKTEKLCVGQTCVTEEQLKALLNNANTAAASTPTQTQTQQDSSATTTQTYVENTDPIIDEQQDESVVIEEQSPLPESQPTATTSPETGGKTSLTQ